MSALEKPLTRDEALAKLRALEPELRAQGVAALYLFGSTARDEAGPDSDVDLFCDLDPNARVGWGFFGIGPFIAERIGRAVDLACRNGLHPLIKTDVISQAVHVYG